VNSKRKIIFGVAGIIVGLFILLFGGFLFIRTTGFDAILYPSQRALDFALVFGIFSMAWGFGWIVTGIIFLVLGLRNYSFNSRKPLALGISLLVLFSIFSGGVILAGLPPNASVSVSADAPQNYTYSGSFSAVPVFVNVTSTYSFEVNVSFVNSSVHVLGFCDFKKGTHDLEIPIYGYTLSPGKGKLEFIISSQSVEEIKYVNFTIYPALSVSFTGPKSVNDANGPVCEIYTSSYVGYEPNNYTWSVCSFYFGNVQQISFSPHSVDLHLTFYLNKSVSNPSGYNYTVCIGLSASNKLGESTSVGGFGYYQIQVTGRD
jgi:hypothetical protein